MSPLILLREQAALRRIYESRLWARCGLPRICLADIHLLGLTALSFVNETADLPCFMEGKAEKARNYQRRIECVVAIALCLAPNLVRTGACDMHLAVLWWYRSGRISHVQFFVWRGPLVAAFCSTDKSALACGIDQHMPIGSEARARLREMLHP